MYVVSGVNNNGWSNREVKLTAASGYTIGKTASQAVAFHLRMQQTMAVEYFMLRRIQMERYIKEAFLIRLIRLHRQSVE